MFKLFKQAGEAKSLLWQRRWSPEGILLTLSEAQLDGVALTHPLLQGFLSQLLDDGLATERDAGYLLDWDALYLALARPAYSSLQTVLGLPPYSDAKPHLSSTHSLTDTGFSIALGTWTLPDGSRLEGPQIGPLMMQDLAPTFLMRQPQWELFKAVVSFARRTDAERTEQIHRQRWGHIRALAVAAEAHLDDFLFRSVVLSPEKLQIGIRRADIPDDKVIEIEPTFEGAPLGWLETFDRASQIRERYDVVTPEGIVQIIITPKVRTVLQEIKRLPGRRVAGSRAEAFLLNPFATLGADAVDVIEESQFEKACEEAGLTYERFTPVFERDSSGYPLRVGLLIETAGSAGPSASEMLWLETPQLATFIHAIRRALSHNHQLLPWAGFDLLLQGDTEQHLRDLEEALARRQTPPTLVSYATIHDLSAYSSRVESIGSEKPYYSAYIAKKNDGDGWFPDNVLPYVVYTPQGTDEPLAVPLNKLAIEKLDRDIQTARAQGKTDIQVPGLPSAISLDEATNICSQFAKVFSDLDSGRSLEEKPGERWESVGSHTKKQLVLRANIQALEYEEARREALQNVPEEPQIPKTIRTPYALKVHQQAGLAWLQHLYSLRTDYHVRGAVLADDMGLGKTFQLLALMAWLYERDPSIAPMLVVAPVSLLENWMEEIEKFFVPGTFPLLTAYGANLSTLRVPQAQIEERLRTEDGLVAFLRPGWVGTAKVVLTTYETLRDLEFSFAAQKWSLMVCDEAQRIKNPSAMVTRAAKKQNVGFRIACTGTPVENTLADMWCLFDYVQPGLLGALNDFGQRYRRPIEAKTEEEKERVNELRAKIAPQILRRLKTEVAQDLPPKILVEECRRLTLSPAQRNLYAKAIGDFKNRDNPASTTPFKNHLGLLHYLRLVCTDPRPPGLGLFRPEPPERYREKSPKLHWLLTQLHRIKEKHEKVIVFCEFREIQRLLQHYIEGEFGIRPEIINGTTSAATSHMASRQKRIKLFQQTPGFGVLILSPIAVGFGVNIQAANHVIHYVRTWNPAKEDQATDRAYRIGQSKPVYVYYPVVCAEDFTTFDVKLDQLLSFKRDLAQDMLNGAGDLTPLDFNIADVVPQCDAEDLDVRVTLDIAQRMEWQLFESLICALWSKQGFTCYRTPGANDHGVDVVALLGNEGQLIQAKTSGTDGVALGWDAVKEVVGGEAFYQRRHPNITFRKVCITNQRFNRQAKDQAELNSVELIDCDGLSALLNHHPVTVFDAERVLSPSSGEFEEVGE